MKKVLFILSFALSLSAIAQQGYRYDIVPGSDNTYSLAHKEIKLITYAATKTLAPTMEQTTYDFAQLTGALTLSVTVTPCYTGDAITCLFKSDATSRIVTFSTGFVSNSTLTVGASASAIIKFVFNGTSWVESSRQNLSKGTNNSRTSTAFTGNATVTAAQLSGGLLTVTSGTDTLTLPTATLIGSQLGAGAGTTFEFILQNSASGGTALIVVGSGIVASGFPGTNTLSLANSATIGIAAFRLTFISATAATLARIN